MGDQTFVWYLICIAFDYVKCVLNELKSANVQFKL